MMSTESEVFRFTQHNGLEGTPCRWSGTAVIAPDDSHCPAGCDDSDVEPHPDPRSVATDEPLAS